MMRIEVSRSTELDRWIKERHYLQSTPAGAKVRLWVVTDDGTKIGAMMWGRPVSRELDQDGILELTRMCFIDETEPFVESRALSLARKHIRKHLPQVKGLLAYSSTGEGHEGIIYKADNWFSVGRSKTRYTGWDNREGREHRDKSGKIKWVRTP